MKNCTGMNEDYYLVSTLNSTLGVFNNIFAAELCGEKYFKEKRIEVFIDIIHINSIYDAQAPQLYKIIQ